MEGTSTHSISECKQPPPQKADRRKVYPFFILVKSDIRGVNAK